MHARGTAYRTVRSGADADHASRRYAGIYEGGGFREIFVDGRPLPKDPNSTWMGYSTGHWDGDTLVIETAGYNDKTWLDFNGHPHTEELHVTERLRRTDFGHMQLQMTFDDSKTYTKPWTVAMPVMLVPDSDLLGAVCQENERDRSHLVGTVPDEQSAAIHPRGAPGDVVTPGWERLYRRRYIRWPPKCYIPGHEAGWQTESRS